MFAYTLSFVLIFLHDFNRLLSYPIVLTSLVLVSIAGQPGLSVGACLDGGALGIAGVGVGAVFYVILAKLGAFSSRRRLDMLADARWIARILPSRARIRILDHALWVRACQGPIDALLRVFVARDYRLFQRDIYIGAPRRRLRAKVPAELSVSSSENFVRVRGC